MLTASAGVVDVSFSLDLEEFQGFPANHLDHSN